MYLLLLLGIAVVLGAGTALAGAAEPATRGAGGRSASVNGGSGVTGPRLADLADPLTGQSAQLSAFTASLLTRPTADRPTCVGLPTTRGGVGTDGDDVIEGTSGNDVIVAGAGNDVIRGRDGKDTICGGPGDDTLVGGRNPADWSKDKHGDRLAGGAGNDRIIDNWGFRDKLIGGSGDDYIRSRSGTEKLLDGGPGADRLISRGGYDTALVGGPGPDVLTALSGAGYNRYHAGDEGRDIIDIGPNGDLVVGLTGDGDQLTVHGDAYVVPGFWNSPVGVEVDMAAGTARRIGADPADPADTITFLAPAKADWLAYGSNHDDVLRGTDGGDIFFGIRGDDTIFGYGDGDGLSGFEGDDVIYGGDGDDFSIDGGQGDDFLDGGEGEDSAEGGKGTDTCVNAESVSKCER